MNSLILRASPLLILAGLSRVDAPPPVPTSLTQVDAPSPIARDLPGGEELGSPEGEPALRLAAGSPWRSDELMVRLEPGVDPHQVAEDHALTLHRTPGPSGLATMILPPGQELQSTSAALREDLRVKRVSRSGAIQGAGKGGGRKTSTTSTTTTTTTSAASTEADYSVYQWHVAAMDGWIEAADYPVSDYIIAVLDTGVAYEDYTDADGTVYVQAPSLAGVTFTAPYDFVNDDDHANDDHQHGTHVTSLIASQGAVMGVAAGVGIMPIKVLDADNSGSEADLIDAIHHAVDNGADVINMSLVFGEGYAPSPELGEALAYADSMNVVMVGAAGNSGSQATRYPAASPLVISVGASYPINDMLDLGVASYGNLGGTVDLVAPGGVLSGDQQGDGYVDGLLAESIALNDPGTVGYWYMAGTSQAAALVSGGVPYVLDAHSGSAEAVRAAFQIGASEIDGSVPFTDGAGAGSLSIDDAHWYAGRASRFDAISAPQELFATVMPYLLDEGADTVAPAATITVFDADGAPLSSDYTVLGAFRSADGWEDFSCVTDSEGSCDVQGSAVDALDDGDEAAHAWAITVDGVADLKVSSATRPFAGLFVSDDLVIVAQALADIGLLEGSLFALDQEAGVEEGLGTSSASIAVIDLGVGVGSRPTALLLTAPAFTPYGAVTVEELDLDGTGLTTDTLGRMSVRVFTFDGSGLTTDTLGFSAPRMLLFNGSGLTTDTLGFTFYPKTMQRTGGSGLTTDTLGFSSARIRMDSGTALDSSSDSLLSATALGAHLSDGGFTTSEGLQGASVLIASGLGGLHSDAGSASAAHASAGAVEAF